MYSFQFHLSSKPLFRLELFHNFYEQLKTIDEQYHYQQYPTLYFCTFVQVCISDCQIIHAINNLKKTITAFEFNIMKINKVLPLLVVYILTSYAIKAQNVAITDDNSYNAHSSAMLDVKSLTKGFLAPRMTSSQRLAIATPTAGLLVFDISHDRYYFFDGSDWIDMSSGSADGAIWLRSAPYTYTADINDSIGIGVDLPLQKMHIKHFSADITGTSGTFIQVQNSNGSYGVMSGIRFWNGTTVNTSKGGIFYQDRLSYGRGDLIFANRPLSDMNNVTADDARLVLKSEGSVEVKGSSNLGSNEALFHVQNADGDTVFAVYPYGVRVYVNTDQVKASGSKGGFAVGGFSPAKANEVQDYLNVTPDSVRVYIDDSYVDTKATGSKGGFAVGGFSPAKGTITNSYLFVQDDSTRVFVNDSTSGFGVENIEGSNKQRIMRLTTENYFIGHESGIAITDAQYNSCVGYKSGNKLTSGDKNAFYGYSAGLNNDDGYENAFFGYMAGKSNTSGFRNVFIGPEAGYSNTTGRFSLFIGYQAGYHNNAWNNVFLGNAAGYSNIGGTGNTCIGNQASFRNEEGSFNTTIGWWAGVNMDGGSNNLYVGPLSGYNNTSGSNNVMLGYNTGNSNYGSGNVFIGCNAGSDESGSDKLYIDNSNTSSPLIYGDFSSNRLGVNEGSPESALHVSNNTNAASQKGLIIDTDGEATDIPLRIRTNTSATGWTDTDTKFVIYGDGGMQLNGGTTIEKIQAGTATVGTNSSGGVKTITITFPSSFTTTPKVNVTVRGQNYSDVFAITTRNISTTSVQVNICRVDSPGGIWGQSLQVDWFAWQ